MEKIEINIPADKDEVSSLKMGDIVFLSGTVYTARDLAHIRIVEYLRDGKALPEDFEGSAIFHAGPVVTKLNESKWKLEVIGPTTSMRMEPFSDLIGKLGVRLLIGKGGMGEKTLKALEMNKAVYLLAAPGCAVKHGKSVVDVVRVHWLDLGIPEAIWVLKVMGWGPLIVGMDSNGNSLFEKVLRESTERLGKLKTQLNRSLDRSTP